MSDWNTHADRLDECLARAEGIVESCADLVAWASYHNESLGLEALAQTLRAAETYLKEAFTAARQLRETHPEEEPLADAPDPHRGQVTRPGHRGGIEALGDHDSGDRP